MSSGSRMRSGRAQPDRCGQHTSLVAEHGMDSARPRSGVGRHWVGELHESILMYIGVVGTLSRSAPPSFVRLAGHPLRWRLLGELAQSDRRVRELVSMV